MKRLISVLLLVTCGISLFSQVNSENTDSIKNRNHLTPTREVGYTLKIDKEPEFPGGIEKLVEFISTSIVYPKKAIRKKIQGEVLVSFVVDRSGKVKNAEVSQSVHPLLDKEALRVVNSMPNWSPGGIGNRTVNVSQSLPINFAL